MKLRREERLDGLVLQRLHPHGAIPQASHGPSVDGASEAHTGHLLSVDDNSRVPAERVRPQDDEYHVDVPVPVEFGFEFVRKRVRDFQPLQIVHTDATLLPSGFAEDEGVCGGVSQGVKRNLLFSENTFPLISDAPVACLLGATFATCLIAFFYTDISAFVRRSDDLATLIFGLALTAALFLVIGGICFAVFFPRSKPDRFEEHIAEIARSNVRSAAWN